MNPVTHFIGLSCYSPLGVFQYYFNQEQMSYSCSVLLQTVAIQAQPVVFSHYFFVFMMTCLLEFPFYFLTIGPSYGTNIRTSVVADLLSNLVTHPIVYWVIPGVGILLHAKYIHVLSVAEVFAPFTEFALLVKIWKIPAARVLPLMIGANLFSWWVGIYLV